MASRFLFNETLWDELVARIQSAKSVRVAVAYLGSGSGHLMPLRKGDKLVVDMSLRAVRSGVTDPREVQKLLRKGVEVFSRASLHAKFFIIDKTVIAGSSNISKHANQALDEAALLTDDAAALRRAMTVFEQLCTEPVRKDYLAQCLKEYRPPKFEGGQGSSRTKRLRGGHAKVWILGGIGDRDVPVPEREGVAQVVEGTETTLLAYERAEVDYIHFASKYAFFARLRPGDWIVVCQHVGHRVIVWPPGRFLGLKSRPRGNGKRRYLLLSEIPADAEAVGWAAFRAAAPKAVRLAPRVEARTTAIMDDADADAILRLWDSRGRFRAKRK